MDDLYILYAFWQFAILSSATEDYFLVRLSSLVVSILKYLLNEVLKQ